jgi:uncharacterized membrane protein
MGRQSRAWIALCVVFVLSLPLVTARIYASDEVEAFAWLHSLAFDRDVSFENEYQYFYDSGQVKNPAFHETFLERTTESGRRVNFTTIGAAMLWAPFYAIGHLVALSTGAPANGFSQPYLTAAATGSAFYGFLAVLLSAAFARRVVGAALSPALAVWIGTPLLFYMYVTPFSTHACSAFAVALFLWVWLRVRQRWTVAGAIALGASAGLMMLVRAQDVFFVAGPALDFLWTVRREGRRGLLTPALAGVAAFFVTYAPQLIAYQALNGHPGPSVYESRKMTWTSPHGWQVLLDPEHGLFAWTPLALLGLGGLIVLAMHRSQPARSSSRIDPEAIGRIAICALVMCLLQAYIAGVVESWTVAGAFGQRRFVSITPLLVLGIAALVGVSSSTAARPRWVRVAVQTAIVLCVWWNLGLMAQFGMHTMDRERVQFGANARKTFLELPLQLPSLAWRYLTNRASFYGQ